MIQLALYIVATLIVVAAAALLLWLVGWAIIMLLGLVSWVLRLER